jgi:hypothetical protein
VRLYGKTIAGEKVQDQGGGGNAVHIIIAPHTEFFSLQQTVGKDVGGCGQIRPVFQRGKSPQGGVEKSPHGLNVTPPPLPKEPRQKKGNFQALGPGLQVFRQRRGVVAAKCPEHD